MDFEVKQEQQFHYIDVGQGEVILLLHGLFGALSNWQSVINYFSPYYRLIVPMLPIYEIGMKQANLAGLTTFIDSFIKFKQLNSFVLLGNSLGGHLALLYALAEPTKIKSLILTASSGLYENTMGGSFVKRNNYEYIAERVKYTFYDPQVIDKEYIDEVYHVIKDLRKAIRVVSIAKSAQRHNLAHALTQIHIPTLLIWGLNDTITPPAVAHDFHMLMPNSQLRFIDRCCHAPMMEHPAKFNHLVEQFLQST
jgi:pimeloyl-ACP methyl ester carboxylesterase